MHPHVLPVTKAVGDKLATIVEMINNAEESSDEDDLEKDQDFEVKRRSSSGKFKNSGDNSKKTSSLHISRGLPLIYACVHICNNHEWQHNSLG